MNDLLEQLKTAFHANDAEAVGALLRRSPEIRNRINEPFAPFDSPAVIHVRSREMLDVLLEAGADINAKTRWWAGGFGLLHQAEPGLAEYAIQRGAVVDVHAAARLGKLQRLRELLEFEPALVRARGGDGQTPLHFAATVEIAEVLLKCGAEIEARDLDHESTPAQWMVRDRQDVARTLVRHGCATDILLVTALGDVNLVRQHLAADPRCIRVRVSEEYFPMINPKSGGTIYQWTLGWHVSPHDVARMFGHAEIERLLLEASPPDVRLVDACWRADEATTTGLLEAQPGLVQGLSESDARQVAHAARNNNTQAVRVMLAAGFPVNALSQHRATPLHWAAFHGNAAMVRDVLRYSPSLELEDGDFQSTPLGWAIHGSEHGWHRQSGDYAGTVEALLKVGARPGQRQSKGTEAVRAALRQYGAGA